MNGGGTTRTYLFKSLLLHTYLNCSSSNDPVYIRFGFGTAGGLGTYKTCDAG